MGSKCLSCWRPGCWVLSPFSLVSKEGSGYCLSFLSPSCLVSPLCSRHFHKENQFSSFFRWCHWSPFMHSMTQLVGNSEPVFTVFWFPFLTGSCKHFFIKLTMFVRLHGHWAMNLYCAPNLYVATTEDFTVPVSPLLPTPLFCGSLYLAVLSTSSSLQCFYPSPSVLLP